MVSISNTATVINKWSRLQPTKESTLNSLQDEQRSQNYFERYRLLSAKVERCVQELIERIYKYNSTLNFELLALPTSHLSPYILNENKEFYYDFYLVWKNMGQIEIERDQRKAKRVKFFSLGVVY